MERVAQFYPKLARKLRDFVFLGIAKQLRCVTGITKQVIRDKVKPAYGRALKKIAWNVCFWLGRPLPISLRSPYILEVYRRAKDEYKLQTYAGSAVIFAPEGSGEHQGVKWQARASGSVKLIEVTGDHDTVLDQPYLEDWARKLNRALQREWVEFTLCEVENPS